MKDEGSNFAESITRASQLPEDSGLGAGADLPQLFQFPIPQNELVVDDEPVPDKRRIKGVPSYRLRAHFNRYMIGSVVNMVNGEMQIDDHDDTVEYEEVQNACLEGKAILCWEKTNFLKDGAVVIAMKWMTKHDKEEYDQLYGSTGKTEKDTAPADIESGDL